jgi:hypothetical protein
MVAGIVGAALLSGGLVLGAEGPFGPALACRAAPQAPAAEPDSRESRLALYLVRATLMALDDAHRTGNYAVLRELAAPAFQASNSAAGLAEVFAAQRRQGIDLSVAALALPRWSRPPAVGDDGLLRLVGSYPLAGDRLVFALAFAAVGGGWRMLEIHVGVEPSAPLRASDLR